MYGCGLHVHSSTYPPPLAAVHPDTSLRAPQGNAAGNARVAVPAGVAVARCQADICSVCSNFAAGSLPVFTEQADLLSNINSFHLTWL
jgi:hypothetical protein